MRSNLINYFFSGKTIQVLFWTLIHSLWQAVVFALFAAIVLMSTKKSGTALRYKLLAGALISFIAVSVCTFCYEIYSFAGYTSAPGEPAIVFSNSTIITNHNSINFIEKLISRLQSYENIIVLAWLSVILIKCLGLIKGLYGVYVLKHRQVFDAGEYWNERIRILAKSTGIKTPVVLLRSFIAEIPMVVGYFKPVILFPAAALTALAPEEIEAILLHELAHIRRKDYLINMFQRIAEIIFFFNPAVLWLSSLIKEERENCCDDIAVKQTKNKKQFIHALVSFQEYNTSAYTTSFSGRKNFLLNRIKRIITNNNKTLNNMEKSLLAAGIVITVSTAFAFSQHKQSVTNIPVKQSVHIALNKKDTLPQNVNSANNNNSTYTISSATNGKQYKLVEVNGKVTEFYVDNVKIPADKISDYNDIIAEMQANFDMAKNQSDALKAKNAAIEAQKTLLLANKSALDSQAKANALNMQQQAAELQEEIERTKMEKDSDQMKSKMEALKSEAQLLQLKALAMTNTKNELTLTQLQALEGMQAKAQKDMVLQLQAEKIAASKNATDELAAQQEKLKAIEKEQELMETKNEKQSKEIKDKTEKIINEELKQQVEELKEQNEYLKQQLREKNIDSLRATPALTPGT